MSLSTCPLSQLSYLYTANTIQYRPYDCGVRTNLKCILYPIVRRRKCSTEWDRCEHSNCAHSTKGPLLTFLLRSHVLVIRIIYLDFCNITLCCSEIHVPTDHSHLINIVTPQDQLAFFVHHFCIHYRCHWNDCDDDGIIIINVIEVILCCFQKQQRLT